jgi:hypothetical protein
VLRGCPFHGQRLLDARFKRDTGYHKPIVEGRAARFSAGTRLRAKYPTKDRDTVNKKPQAVVAKISTLQDREKQKILEKSARFLLTRLQISLLCGQKWERVVGSRKK